jgi:hypothetical protein
MSDTRQEIREGATAPVTVKGHFTPDNIAVLKQAYEIVCEISYTGGAWEGRDVARDARVIDRAEFAASAIHKLLIGAAVYYGMDFMDEPVPEPQSLKVTP